MLNLIQHQKDHRHGRTIAGAIAAADEYALSVQRVRTSAENHYNVDVCHWSLQAGAAGLLGRKRATNRIWSGISTGPS